MKIVCIADTHDQQGGISMPPGDLLIIAGDFTIFGNIPTFGRFVAWLNVIAPAYPLGVIIISGNHDWGLDAEKEPTGFYLYEAMLRSVPGVTYLCDSGTEVNGFKIWGSPVTPYYCGWAFNRHTGAQIKAHWDLIPTDTDILITHGPAMGILDNGLGCADLRTKLKDLTNLKLHVFGHIHPPFGVKFVNSVTHVNAAQCLIKDNAYVLTHTPITIKL